MNVIELQDIGKRYDLPGRRAQEDRFWALKDISLNIKKGEIAGVVGRNGAGKTTLLKVIAGLIQPTTGSRRINGGLCSLFTLDAGFENKLNGIENVFRHGALLGMSDREIKGQYRNIIDFSGLGEFIDLPLGSYSNGMRLRLGFSIALHSEFDILVVDEVLLAGDGAFQQRCFEMLQDLRRKNKAMFITTHSLDLVERLCSKVFLLEKGCLINEGTPQAVISIYRQLLNERKEPLPIAPSRPVIKETKWWADNRERWGSKEGTKEAVIESVKITNRWGRECRSFRPAEQCTVKVIFTVREEITCPHFGIALFREDGVYCYGPNTFFDEYAIQRLGKGRGVFLLEYKSLLLMPGRYYLSVGIWDKKEIIAYDYHNALYEIEITGKNDNNQLLYLPFSWGMADKADLKHIDITDIKDIRVENDVDAPDIDSVEFLDSRSERKEVFFTGEKMEIVFDFKNVPNNGDLYAWSGIFRKDGIFCHGTGVKFGQSAMRLSYPRLPLLPGEYFLSAGIWSERLSGFMVFHHGQYPFRVFFHKRDHGTVYLEHKWKWRFPREVSR
ncbi:MAG: Wzt carbohydrate-binding domain-containing protein [Candidatus Omnitrophota bacterium]